MDLATEATETNGNALANQEKYEESLEGKLQALSTEANAFWIDFLNTDAISNGIDLLTGLVSIIDKLVNSAGALGTISLGAGLFAGAKNIGKRKMYLFCFEYADSNKFSYGYISFSYYPT
jgi:hypothetical protein